ncbi:hypothetical protein QE152_g1908 [Popillia japonica]|uniref:Uncharacterized protein n=1 Tax=Popillia japonica TaxID=7064 RepID=A0AAW1N4L0_POPJA
MMCEIHGQFLQLNLKQQVHNYKIFYTRKAQETKRNYNDNFINQSDNKSKAEWAVINKKPRYTNKNIALQHYGQNVSKQEEVANILNEFVFVSVGTMQGIPSPSYASQDSNNAGSLYFQPVTTEAIISTVRKLGN